MKRIVLLVFFLLGHFAGKSDGDIGPVFAVRELYERVPVVCKATVQAVKVTSREEMQMGSPYALLSASLKVHRYYKGDGPETIEVEFPSGDPLPPKDFLKKMRKFIFQERARAVHGWGWRHLEEGQTLLFFLKEQGEGGHYRFWVDVYDSFMPISIDSSSTAQGFQAIREDIVDSIYKNGELSDTAIDQASLYGWREALLPLKSVTMTNVGLAYYMSALRARLFFGDRSAIEESLKFFDESFANVEYLPYGKKHHVLVSQIQKDFLSYYARMATRTGQNLIKSIDNGERPWLKPQVIKAAQSIAAVVTPEEIIETGDRFAGLSWEELEKCRQYSNLVACQSTAGLGGFDKLIKVAGRQDWYDRVQFDYKNRNHVYLEIQKWWQDEGRDIFMKEMEAE